MYGLAVIEVMTLSGHLSNIDEMYVKRRYLHLFISEVVSIDFAGPEL